VLLLCRLASSRVEVIDGYPDDDDGRGVVAKVRCPTSG